MTGVGKLLVAVFLVLLAGCARQQPASSPPAPAGMVAGLRGAEVRAVEEQAPGRFVFQMAVVDGPTGSGCVTHPRARVTDQDRGTCGCRPSITRAARRPARRTPASTCGPRCRSAVAS